MAKPELSCPSCWGSIKANAVDGCTRQRVEDLSNNLCPECQSYHTLHCRKDLSRIQTNLEFWCNRCKIQHEFMRCIPHCIKCYRRHSDDFPCPWPDAPNTETLQRQQSSSHSLQQAIEEQLRHQNPGRTSTHHDSDSDDNDERKTLADALISLQKHRVEDHEKSEDSTDTLEVHLNDKEVKAIVQHLESNPDQEPAIFSLISKIKN